MLSDGARRVRYAKPNYAERCLQLFARAVFVSEEYAIKRVLTDLSPTKRCLPHLGTCLLNPKNYLDGLNANLAWAIRASLPIVSGRSLRYPQY